MSQIPGTIPETGARAKTKGVLNRHSQLLRSNRLQRSAGMRRRVGPHGERYIADVDSDPAEGLDIRRMIILGVAEDYVTASEHPDTDGDGVFETSFPNPVPIAKPPAFRVNHGLSGVGEVDWVIDTGQSFNTRHYGNVPGMILTQWIYPVYVNGAEIYVLFGIKNGTGVIVDGEHLHAMDITPGRVWTDALQQVCVKIGTKKEQIKVRGSSPTITP